MSVVVKKPPRPGSPATDILVDLAVRALVEEVRLTPKPGLVDLRGPGAHDDLSLGLMLRSAESLRATFADVADACEGARVDRGLREVLGAIGREGEAEMLAATGGANAHRGAIWTLGLLVAGAVLSVGESEGDRIAASAARIARLPDAYGVPRGTNGARVRSVHGVAGATGEARAGFPHVVGIALPALRAGRKTGRDEDTARIDALLGIMAVLDDTCLLHRGGLRGLRLAQRGAARVLEAGGFSVPEGRRALASLEIEMLEEWLSPGGAADLLSAAMFLDSLEQRESDGESVRAQKGRVSVESLSFSFETERSAERRVHVGVVGSGDLEILLEPREEGGAEVSVLTSVDGYEHVWSRVLDRFFSRRPLGGRYEIRDFGATPGVVSLRLAQAAAEAS